MLSDLYVEEKLTSFRQQTAELKTESIRLAEKFIEIAKYSEPQRSQAYSLLEMQKKHFYSKQKKLLQELDCFELEIRGESKFREMLEEFGNIKM
jgi:hypothetical protein